MFLKLVKHEFRETYRLLIPLLGGLLLMAGLARGSIWISEQSNNSMFSAFGFLIIGVIFLACAAAAAVTMVLMVVRFARSVHGDEGYLTNTLPVGVHAILLSRLLVTCVSLVTCYLVIYLSIRLCLWKVSILGQFGDLLRVVFGSANVDWNRVLLQTALSGLGTMVSSVLLIFAAISIGHSFNTHKAGFSVLFYFVLSITASLLSSAAQSLLFGGGTGQTASGIAQMSDLTTAFAVGRSLVLCAIYYFLTWLMTKKRLNLA